MAASLKHFRTQYPLMPGTANVGSNVKELKSINNTPGRHRPPKQILAIALSQARKAGADIAPPKKRKWTA